MNADEEDAYTALADGGKLIDPKYAYHPAKEEADLKLRVKKAWSHRKHFPAWVEAYVQKWAAAKDAYRAGIPSDVEGSALG